MCVLRSLRLLTLEPLARTRGRCMLGSGVYRLRNVQTNNLTVRVGRRQQHPRRNRAPLAAPPVPPCMHHLPVLPDDQPHAPTHAQEAQHYEVHEGLDRPHKLDAEPCRWPLAPQQQAAGQRPGATTQARTSRPKGPDLPSRHPSPSRPCSPRSRHPTAHSTRPNAPIGTATGPQTSAGPARPTPLQPAHETHTHTPRTT